MIQRKDKVSHPVQGNGIVENLSNNESVAMVDFKGKIKRCEVANLKKGVNTYTPKPELRKVLAEVQKLQQKCKNELLEIENRLEMDTIKLGARIKLDEFIDDLEKVLQGKK